MEVSTRTKYNSKFCDKCDNLMVVTTEASTGRSFYRCRMHPDHPEHRQPIHGTDRIVVVVRTYGDGHEQLGRGAQNEGDAAPDYDTMMLLSDPTLARIKIQCPKADCECQSAVSTKVNASALVFRYVCEECNHSWTNK